MARQRSRERRWAECRDKAPENVACAGQPAERSGFVVVRLDETAKEIERLDDSEVQGQVDRLLHEAHAAVLVKAAKELKESDKENIQEQIQVVLEGELPPPEWTPLVSLKAEQIRELEAAARSTDLPPLHSLTMYWRVDVRKRGDWYMKQLLRELNDRPEVDLAYRELAASDPDVDLTGDTWARCQGYLGSAPKGINAAWAWTQESGAGQGVAFVDLEQGWLPDHEDLVGRRPVLAFNDNRDGHRQAQQQYQGNHGTAVLGVTTAESNRLGVLGIANKAGSVSMVSHFNRDSGTNGHVADALLATIETLAPGDVLLVEVQRGYGPAEIDEADFDAIRLASAHGIIVIEAAGNGGTDLDRYRDSSNNRTLNRCSSGFHESGAILVGACVSTVPHDRIWFSNFGSRVDCFAWGENVVSCGYGDLDAGDGDCNRSYTDSFCGTSSAAAIIAGAALVIQGLYQANTGARLSPCRMRELLASPALNTPQGRSTAGSIGVMPDLQAIVNRGLGIVPDLYLRDHVGDSGAVPKTGRISASPDILIQPKLVSGPEARFGHDSGSEGMVPDGTIAVASRECYVYVRMRNRGLQEAREARATVYWSRPATVITPDLLSLIGTTDPVVVPQGDVVTVAGPLPWKTVPKTGHYCLVAIVGDDLNPIPPLKPPQHGLDWDGFKALERHHYNAVWPEVDWQAFQAFMRSSNRVAVRNHHNPEPPTEKEPAALELLINGTPDQARVFDLQIEQRLPPGARVELEVPLALARKLSQCRIRELELCESEPAKIMLPRQPRLWLRGVHLAAGVRYPSRFIVHAAEGMRPGRYGISIRQVHKGVEAGRVTWSF
jgi:hypothetical protein